ncbi:hypothetical protein C8R44DRAFT_883545 [Mycena epipterygia]|nr:hypothetical protein C8R44DRAFT_883545 [Mycena epipterygia]
MSDAPLPSRERAVHISCAALYNCVGSRAVDSHAAPIPINPSMSPSLDFAFDVDAAYLSISTPCTYGRTPSAEPVPSAVRKQRSLWSKTNANTECMFLRDAGSPTDLPSYRARAATSRSRPHDAISWRMRLPWRPTQYPKQPLSVAYPLILRALLSIVAQHVLARTSNPLPLYPCAVAVTAIRFDLAVRAIQRSAAAYVSLRDAAINSKRPPIRRPSSFPVSSPVPPSSYSSCTIDARPIPVRAASLASCSPLVRFVIHSPCHSPPALHPVPILRFIAPVLSLTSHFPPHNSGSSASFRAFLDSLPWDDFQMQCQARRL